MRVLYFAWVRERIGVSEEEVMPPASLTSIADLVDWLATRSDGHAAALSDRARLRAAIDQQFVAFDALLGDAHEVAIFPPVTGG